MSRIKVMVDKEGEGNISRLGNRSFTDADLQEAKENIC